jgi:hypothetical protein
MFLIAEAIKTKPTPITAAEFAQKVAEAVIMLIDSVSGIIIPVATLSLLISIVLFIVGGFMQSSSIKKAGAGGIGATILGLILYYAAPTIVSLLSGLQLVFK